MVWSDCDSCLMTQRPRSVPLRGGDRHVMFVADLEQGGVISAGYGLMYCKLARRMRKIFGFEVLFG